MNASQFASRIEETEEPDTFEDCVSVNSLSEDTPAPEEFRIALFCPLPVERDATLGALDTIYSVDPDDYKTEHGLQRDLNDYRLGTIDGHDIVICRPPDKSAGPIVAAMGWRDLSRSFPEIKYVFIVGVGGGVPSFNDPDIRLGDVVIGLQDKGHPGMIQLDAGHQTETFVPLINMNVPPKTLQALAERLINFPNKTHGHSTKRANIFKETANDILKKLGWEYPGLAEDCCFKVGTSCVDKQKCPVACRNAGVPQLARLHRTHAQQFVHGGLICSSSKVIKDARFRDQTVDQYYEKGQILCFETEGYGIALDVSCLNIRGISDYADCHKTSQWQPYAAAHAAAAAKIIVMLLIATSQAKDTPKTPVRKTTVIPAAPVSPEYKPAPRANTFQLPRHTAPFRTKDRANTNPPDSVLGVIKVVPDLRELSRPDKGKQAVKDSNSPPPELTGEEELHHPGQTPVSQTFEPSLPKVISEHRARSGSVQWEPVSPELRGIEQTDTTDRIPDMRGSVGGASIDHQLSHEDPYINGKAGDKLDEPRHPSFSSTRKSSHGSSQLSPFQSQISRHHTRSDSARSIETPAVSPTKSNRLTPDAIPRVPSSPNRTFPTNYRILDEAFVERFNHGRICQFSMEIYGLESPQYRDLTHQRYGQFTGHFEIDMHCIPPATIPSKLLTFCYDDDSGNGPQYVQFWIPVDEVEFRSYGTGFSVRWSDCESLASRTVENSSQYLREYHAQLPNMRLYIDFREEEDKHYFRDKLLNQDLQWSPWTIRKSPVGRVEDAYGREIKVYYRPDDTSFRAGILITTNSPPSEGNLIKIHRMKQSFYTLLEITVDARGSAHHFVITELWTIDYLADPERRFYFDSDAPLMKSGKPVKQMYHEQSVATKGQDALVIKLTRERIPRFLEMLFWWTLIFDEHAASIRFKGRTKADMMLLLYKHDEGSYWFLCCNTDAKLHEKKLEDKRREWFLFEYNLDRKKELKRKHQTITIPVRRWKATNILSHDQFHYRFQEEKLQLAIDFRTATEVERIWPVVNALRSA